MKFIHADKDELNFPLAPQLIQKLKSVDVESIRRYQKQPKMINFLANLYEINENRIFLESGMIGVIHRVFDYYINSYSKVLLPELGYPYYFEISKYRKAKIQIYKFLRTIDGFKYDENDLIHKIEKSPNLLVLVDPEAPTGFSITEKLLVKLLNTTHENTLVFIDQTHEGFRDNNQKDVKRLIEEFPNLLIARSFSKFYGLAGIRIAYALCGKSIKTMIEFKERYLGFNNIAQELAMAAISATEHYKQNAYRIREQKESLRKNLESLKQYNIINTDTGSLLIEVPNSLRDKIYKLFEDRGIKVRWLGSYHPRLENFIRITACLEEETIRILDVFREGLIL